MVSSITDRVYGESSGVAVKAPCLSVATTPLPLSGLGAVGPYTPNPGDRILVTGQPDATANGIYDASATAWTRSGDCSSVNQVVQGTLVVVLYPNANGTIYQLTTINPLIGASPLIFTPYVSPNITYMQTPVEAAQNITPYNTTFPEGDWRRYGANQGNADNSGPGNSALLVSSAGGSAAYVPPGTWNITNPLVRPTGASMYGAGASTSIIAPANGVDGFQITTGDATYGGSTFRDFQIKGALNVSRQNNAHGVFAVAGGFILDLLFENVAILNFNWGFFLTNVEDSTISSCLVQNCWNGIFCNNQSVNVFLLTNTVNLVSTGPLISGSGNSIAICVQGAPEVEGLHVQSNTVYGYDYGLNFGLVQEVQICANDIANCNVCCIYFTSTLAGMVIRDNYMQLGPAASGTWNAGSPGNLTGIFVTAVSPSVNTKVHIHDNEIEIDVTLTGSTGIYLGSGNSGIVCNYNNISSTNNWDIGIGGGNTTINNGGACQGAHIIGNSISAVTTGVLLSNLGNGVKIGPNYFPGAPTAPANNYVFTGGSPTAMEFSEPDIPMKGTQPFAAATFAAVAFANSMPFSTYRVTLGGNAAGYCWVTSKSVNGFTINCSASNSNSVDWAISA